jgi:hypothetical protein
VVCRPPSGSHAEKKQSLLKAGATLRPASQAKSIVADDTSKGIVPDEMEDEIFPAMAADPLGIPRTHRTIDHRTFP